jgi:hypothetical protein
LCFLWGGRHALRSSHGTSGVAVDLLEVLAAKVDQLDSQEGGKTTHQEDQRANDCLSDRLCGRRIGARTG